MIQVFEIDLFYVNLSLDFFTLRLTEFIVLRDEITLIVHDYAVLAFL